MRRFWKNNSLSIVIFGLFLASWIGHALTGWFHYNGEREEHGSAPVTLSQYLGSGDFMESTFENWESEFFQMAAFVLISACLVQRGSAESKDPDEDDESEMAPRPDSPWPVRKGGFALALYSRSLGGALSLMFAVSFALHALSGRVLFNEEAAAHHRPALSLGGYLFSSSFWFESFQNWQSEFLSVAALIVLSIYLRQKGSPESKPVNAPHGQTGT